ncbi:G-type lectin S-receptor-like serine/threonine-protein kinase At4g27290 [Rosa chinensis]|uniref:G-type lectin S-receptor-like serine/threonine-protein kinase At4g27290 n=1 Tax=Rosa chinensis TaxID=74649 RepID=UPI000D08E320|nr:G-type lectin S-receptor-like serine/threonine-protein kinase At4g27290 [Rosa chinensis]XP_024160060.1 G-type lectin S-receptor-like serine/threonine-protein kinase At4g27290 [Rosa chinensis]XP_024160061.1 G-type lectin S-receptor-like serine/threonine-protein kinase At4g27290 [Rosa chinensis]XP_024160062.1 G-type lectin S-receptor-like serine/threonine-protein kinase At4g27290 [Rosa chinensis]XP_040363201.1 G-type lectin S-receptor-like serine/threonine-protein kinase At4g27290 [Rosa chinen
MVSLVGELPPNKEYDAISPKLLVSISFPFLSRKIQMKGLPFILFISLFHVLVFSLCSAVDTISPTQSITSSNTLVSSGGRFELGLFSSGNSKAWYLGIWYTKFSNIVVWVANRENPIPGSDGALTLTENGTLVLLDQMNNTVWYSNFSTVVEDPVAQLLETGNFVVRDKATAGSESFVWQSFDFPSDTLLAGMKLGWDFRTGLNKFLTSWKNASDPSLGEYTYRIVNLALPQLVLAKGSEKEFRSGPWNGLRFTGYPVSNNEIITPSYVYDTNELYYTYNDNSLITRLRLTEGGDMQRLVLNKGSTEWNDMYNLLNDRCDRYGECGANGICRINNSPICDCLDGFIPKSQQEWVVLNTTSGCTRKIQLDCQKGEGFREIQNVKLPDLLDFWVNKSRNKKECRAECLKNCSCIAYSYSDYSLGGTGCLMWFKDLIDIREFADESEQQRIYIRMPASELGHAGQKEKRIVLIAVISAACVLILLGVSCWLIIWKKKGKKRGSRSNKEDMELPLFDFHTIAAGTNNFSGTNILGEGGFGPVYKANLAQEQLVAVKRLSKDSGQGIDEFKNEVTMIANLQHRNLVKLLGCCIEGQERMLIYEYMPNKSLNCFIFDENRKKSLDWQKRVNIIIGTARGLLYLHQDSRLRIIHRDLKSSNILLDNELNPKISDFGIARIFGLDQTEAKTKRVIGTYGYMSPEYAIDGHFSVKSDVFSFGVLLLEMVSGRKNRGFHHPDHHHSLLGHAWLLWNKEKVLELLDPCLEDSYVELEVLRCIQVGLLCVQKRPIDRPVMSSVVFMLSNEGAMLPEPKEPGFFTERSSMDGDTFISEGRSKTGNMITITTMEAR